MPSKALSDEELIAALLQQGTISGAAAALSCSRRTVYDRMHHKDFRNLYEEAKTDILRTAVLEMNAGLSDAVRTVVAVMNDDQNPANVRLQAAGMIIANAGKFSERLRIEERTEAINSVPDPLDAFGI